MQDNKQRTASRSGQTAKRVQTAGRSDNADRKIKSSSGSKDTQRSARHSGTGAKTQILYIFVGAIACAMLAILLTTYFDRHGTGATGSYEKPVGEIQSSSSPVLITEVMSDNASVIQDSYEEFSDWFELTNVSNDSVNLYGWKVARDTDTTKFFEFPDVTLRSGQSVLVFCTNVLENTAGFEFHAPFKLSSAGCMLILYDYNGRAMQSFNVPDLKTNNSYVYIDGN